MSGPNAEGLPAGQTGERFKPPEYSVGGPMNSTHVTGGGTDDWAATQTGPVLGEGVLPDYCASRCHATVAALVAQARDAGAAEGYGRGWNAGFASAESGGS